MAGTPTDAGDSAKPAAASPPINADTILFRMPTTAAAKPEGQDKPVESAPATDVTTKLQAENPYLNQPAPGSSVEVARINATQTATGNVREQTVQTSDGPQAVKISQQGEKQTVFNNSGQQLYETRVNGQSVYSAVKPEATTRAATPGKPEVATTPPAAAKPEPAVVRESGPSAASIQAKAIETAAADTRAVQVRSVTTDAGNNGGNQGKGILASDVPRVVTPPGDARNPVVVENKGQQPETKGQQPETRGLTPQPETRGLTPQPETRNQGVEPRTVTSPDGKTSDGKSTVTPGSVDAPQVAVKSVNPINPSNPVSPIPGSTAERAVTRNDGTPPQVAAVAERSLAANQPFIAQVKSQEGARDTAIATGTDGRPNPGALQQPGQSPGKPDAQIKGDNPAVTPNPATKPDVSSVTVGNLGGQPIDKGFQNPTGPKPGEVQNPTMPKPGDGQNPTLPKPGEVQNPTLPKPGEVQNPAQPRPGDGQLSAQPPLGQPLKPGDLPPVGQPIVRPGDIVPPGQRPLDGQLPLAQKPVDGALMPGQQGQQKPPEGTPLKPGEVVPGKNALHIDEEIAARLKDLGQTLKPGLPGQEIGKGLPGDLTALNLGKDGKALIPANTLAEGKADLKVDLQALAQNASKPGSGVELNAVLKGLGLEGTKPGDMHGVVNVDAKTLANLDPKAVEALVKAQAEMLGKGPAADATKGLGVELAGAKGDLRGIDLKGLDAAKQVDPLKTLEAGKAQPALTAMELANQLNKPLPVDKVAGASDLTVKPETVKVGVDGLALKPETTIKPEGGLKPEAGVKTEAAGTKVGESLTTATVTESMRTETSIKTEAGDGFGQNDLGLDDGGEEDIKEKEKRLAFSAKQEEEWELRDKKTRKQTEESLLEEEQKNNAKNAMLAAMLAQTKEQEAERERQLLMEEAKRKGEDKRRRYVVKDKDTLESIAKKQLRDVRLSALIYEINKHMLPVRMEKGRQVVDPRPGTSIWLPSEADIKQFRSRLYANPRSTTLPGGATGGATSGPALGAGMTAEQELAAQFGANWDGKSKSAASVSAGMMGAAVAKSQVRRANIEKILGPMGQKAGETTRIRYIVRLGDSLDAVASKHPALKDAELWPLLATINELSDEVDDEDKPVAVLRRGMVLNLPTPFEIEQYRNSADVGEDDDSDMSPELASAMTESVSQVLSATRSHTQLNATLDRQALGDENAQDVNELASKAQAAALAAAAELRARAAAHAAAAAAAEAAADSQNAESDAAFDEEYDTDYDEENDAEDDNAHVQDVVSPVVASDATVNLETVPGVPSPVVPSSLSPAPHVSTPVVPQLAPPALPQAASQAGPSFMPVTPNVSVPVSKTLLNPTMPLPQSTQGNLPSMPQSVQAITGPVAPLSPGMPPAPDASPTAFVPVSSGQPPAGPGASSQSPTGQPPVPQQAGMPHNPQPQAGLPQAYLSQSQPVTPVNPQGLAPQQSPVPQQPSPQPTFVQPNVDAQAGQRPPQPTFTPVSGGHHEIAQSASGPITQPVAAPGMEILQREPIIAGDRLMWELYTGIRLVKSSVKWEPAIGVFRAQLEMLIGPVWYPVIFYEAFPTGAVRHEYSPGGKRKSVRIDLPPATVQELADNDLVSKWTIYCRAYLAQMQGPKA